MPVSDNEARMRAAYAAMAPGDLEGIGEILTDDVEYRNPPTAIEPGVRRGRAEFLDALGRLFDQFDYVAVEPERVEELGDLIAVEVRVRASGAGSGAPIDETFGHLLGFRGGRLASLEWWSTPQDAFAALRERAAG